MRRQEIINKIDLSVIKQLEIGDEFSVETYDYVCDKITGAPLMPISPIQVKILEKLKRINERLIALEVNSI